MLHLPDPSRPAARTAVASTSLFVVLLALEHLLRPDLDPSWRFISEYEIGAYGAVMRLAFLALSVGTFALGVTLWSQLRTIPGYIGLGMLATTAVGLAFAGLFVSDPMTADESARTTAGRLHELGAMMDLAPYAAPFLNLTLARNPAWAGSRRLLLVSAWLPLFGMLVFGGAMATMYPPDGQFGPEVQVGWANRFFMLTQCAWQLIVAASALALARTRRLVASVSVASRTGSVAGVLLLLVPCALSAQAPAADGRRDFDFEIGTWRTQLKLLVSPVGAPAVWAEYAGTTLVTPVWGGDANLVELDVTGPRGRLVGLSLRLYDPNTRQWSLNFSNARSGVMATPSVGGFVEGRGEFHSHEVVDGRTRWVRFAITPVTDDSIHFEQSVSSDGGRTWTPNWIAIDTRVREGAKALPDDLVETIAAFDRAQVAADTATLARLVTEDYVLVNSDATVDRKAKYLADFRLPGVRLEPYVIEQRVEKAWDDAAVVFGKQRLAWMQDGERHRRTLRIVHVWTKRAGRWQATHTQLTRVPEA